MNLRTEDLASGILRERVKVGASLADGDPMNIDKSISFVNIFLEGLLFFKVYILFLKQHAIKVENPDIPIISVLMYLFGNLALWSHVMLTNMARPHKL